MYLKKVLLFLVLLSEKLLHREVYALNDDLEELHLQMHIEQCGDAALCDNMTAHLEPTDFVLPLPCCVPCSCLPTCWINQNCCPAMWNHSTIATNNQTGENAFQVNLGNQLVTNDTFIITQPINAGTEASAPADKNQTTEAFERSGFTTSPAPDAKNTNNLVSEEGKEMQPLNERKYDVEAVCTRSQVLYEPNRFLDSRAYMMAVTCPSSYQDAIIRDKCLAGMKNADLSDMVPVTSSFTGLTYVNKYCLICNELEALDQFAVQEWETKVVSYSKVYFYLPILSFSYLIGDLSYAQFGHSNVHFEPKVKELLQECKKYDIASCNQTGLMESYDETIERICHYGHNLPILHRVNFKRRLFKNIACVHCNVADGFKVNEVPCDYGHEISAYEYSLSLNVKSIHDDGGGQDDDLMEEAIIQKPTVGSCPRGYVDLMGRCRRLYCPRDFYRKNNECLPVYKVLTGLDLNVKITATPKQDIPKKVSTDFIDRLKELVNKTISKTITLQIREVAVLFRPKSQTNPRKYYFFDVYLFNASSIIHFDVAVNEIKVFVNALNSQKVNLVNENAIDLQFEFNHRIKSRFDTYSDTSAENGGTLRPLMGKGWKINPRKPHMKISDLHWQFRIAFETVEAVRITRMEYRIMPTNITVHDMEYDYLSRFPLVNDLLFVRVNLFASLINVDQKQSDSAKTSDSLDEMEGNSESEVQLTVGQVSVIVVCALFGLVLLTVLCKVQFASRKTPHNPQTGENQNSTE